MMVLKTVDVQISLQKKIGKDLSVAPKARWVQVSQKVGTR